MALITVHGVEIETAPGVYEPAEDSELLVEAIETTYPDGLEGRRVADVGTGTGLAACILAREGARVIATDVNPIACRLARANAARNGLHVEVVQCDVLEAVAGPFDLIVSNPPYLPTADHERRRDLEELALDGGTSGVEPSERLIEQAEDRLAPSGEVILLASSLADLDRLNRAADAAGFDRRVVAELGLGLERLLIYRMHRTLR